jgi:AraC family transcriptional regulator, transcriptional activator of pobA
MNMSENQKVILYKTASTAQFPDDFQTRFHTHIYCQSGTVKFMFNGKQYHCKKGEFIFWLAGLHVSDCGFQRILKQQCYLWTVIY